ncbi:transmembrane protein 266, partial [Pteropus vampyrus]|uniref:Transmembrane protein 266 n=1 Tax=Pteropus vampyrus TaxID=132908 RepID=A0A6P6BZD9_PTEVA
MGLRGHCWPQGSLGSSVSSWVAVPEPRLLYRKRWGRESWAGRSEPSPGPSSKGLRVCVCKWSMVRWVQEMILEREAGSEHHSRGPGPCSWVPGAVTRTSCLASSPQTVLRIVVLGIWDYIENKIEVFDGAVIILSVAPMVASTVANGPRSPWDAISLIIMLRIWRVKRVIDAYVLPVKVEMEMAIQQYEKAKVIQDEQLERLTQICQEQGFEIRQLRAHLAQQGLDLAAEREAALLAPQVCGRPHSRYHAVEETATEGLVEGLRPSPDTGAPEPAMCVVTTAAIDVHQPNVSSDLFSVDVPLKLGSSGTHVSTSESA